MVHGLTICKRPSYLPQLSYSKPYYSKDDIFGIGFNMGINGKEDDYDKLCKLVAENDITAELLIKHQKHME